MIFDRLLRKGSSRILSSADLARYLGAGSSSAAGVDVTPERALALAAVFACVRVLAESVGQLPLHLYRRTGDRERVKATDHPLYSLLHDAPNTMQTAQEFKEFVVASLALRGNAYAQIIKTKNGRVLELWPWNPAKVGPEQDKHTSKITYKVRLASGQEQVFPADEVLHLKLFSTTGGLEGASPVGYARESIGLGIATEQHGASLFANGANPGGIVSSDNEISEKAYGLIKESWENRHQGSGNAGRIAFLEDGLKFEPIGMSSVDVQHLETRKYQRSEIAGIFRVPAHLIGDLERATFSNIEHSSLDYVVHGLMPYLTRIEQRIALQLLTPAERGEYFAKFQVGGLLRGDMTARSVFYTRMLQNGALSPNEIRELEDMNPREDGDIWLTPVNLTPNPGQDALGLGEPSK